MTTVSDDELIARLEVEVAEQQSMGEPICGATVNDAAARLRSLSESKRELEEALADLMSWFPDEPSKPTWALTAGAYGADDAVNAARAVIAKEAGHAE